jgi:hypothetical protein
MRYRLLALLAALLLALGPLTAAGVAASASGDTDTIQQVIVDANNQQARALTSHDPAPMADTATSAHFQELVDINKSLLANGVVAIKLVQIDWGQIDVNATKATATTWETWSTRYDDGTIDLSRDQNTYTLVKEGGSWKIASDSHPDTEAPPPPSSPASPRPPAPLVPPHEGTSRNWSGYATTDGSYTAISASWTVPQPALDGSYGASAAWVGIGGVTTPDLIQAGTEEVVLATGRIRYQAWIETLPLPARRVALTVNPGDSISVSLEEQDPQSWHVSFTDNTTGEAYDQLVPYSSSHSSAEWVEEAPSTGRAAVLPLDHFGELDFTDASTATSDGSTLTIADAGARPITMIDDMGAALAIPTPLGDDGASFTINRADSQPDG